MPKVTCVAFRKDLGPTGGPGGVLHVMQRILKEKQGNIDLSYIFRPKRLNFLIASVSAIGGRMGFGVANIQAMFYAMFCIGKNQSYFVTHDIGTAVGLAITAQPYLLVYHHQGTLYDEHLLSRKHNSRIKWMLGLLERIAFARAKGIAFPSKGAKEIMLDRSQAARNWVKANGVRNLYILLNTVLIDSHLPDQNELTHINQIPKKGKIFVSIGALTNAKGIDQIPSFLQECARQGIGEFTWIVIGKGKLELLIRDKIKLAGISENTHLITTPVQHAVLMKLLETTDYYIMLHRLSIFDFASLEAMRSGCALILSDEGGNRDFNIDENVILVDPVNREPAITRLLNTDLTQLRKKNAAAFSPNFGQDKFRDAYLTAIVKCFSKDPLASCRGKMEEFIPR